MITLVKFITNRVAHTDNKLITRTLGKVGVVKKEYYAVMNPRPRHDEFWFAEVLEELSPSQSKGCWILKPLRKIGTTSRRGFEEPDVIRLIPGTFDLEKRGNTLYVYPHEVDSSKGPNWILDTELRRELSQRYKDAKGDYGINSIVVVFDEPAPSEVPVVQPPTTLSTDPIVDFEAMAEELESEND
jgi:hypothetical protein